MEEKDLIKKIRKESERNVPDVYNKILFAARTEGLLNDTEDEEEVYFDGQTVALGGVNKKVVAITTLAALAAVSLAIALPLALSSNNGGGSIPPVGNGGDKVVADIGLGDSYAVGAVSTAKLLGSFTESSSASAKAMARRSGSESEIAAFKNYFYAFDTFFGETMAQPVKTAEPNLKYANGVTIKGERANGDEINYSMYYTEAKIVDSSAAATDPIKYYIEGVITVGYGQMLLLGERTVPAGEAGGAETELTISAYPNEENKNTYVKMDLERTVEGENIVNKYNYTIVVNGSTLGGAVLYRPVEGDGTNLAFALDVLGIGSIEDVSYDVLRSDDGGNQFLVNYNHKYDKGSFCIAITKSGYEQVLFDLFVYKLNGDGTCEITGYDKNKTLPANLVIPSSYDGNKVVAIGSSAFSSCHDIENVFVPDSVERIGASAFYDSSLKEITLPATLKAIERETFKDCKNLKSLHIPASVESIDAPWAIELGALESLTVADDNPVYESKGNCLIEKSTKNLIYGCTNSIIPSDGSVIKINQSAFKDCHFNSIEIPEGITEIGYTAFIECKELQTVSLPDSLKTMWLPFKNCESLESLHIPAGVTNIAVALTSGCNSLTSITVDQSNQRYESRGNCVIDKSYDIATKTYNMVIAGCKTSIIPDDAGSIGPFAFADLSVLTQIEIPSSVSRICAGAFERSGLTSIEIPDSVEYIDSGVFHECKNLRAVKLSDNLKLLDSQAFMYCEDLESIIIPESVVTIGEDTFLGCTNLTNIVLLANIEVLEECTFAYSGVTQIVIPSGVTEIGEECFRWSDGLASVTIPESVTQIAFQAFYGCTGLKEITFEGTLDEWDALEKGTGWYYAVTGCTVTCSDGQSIVIDWYNDLNS